MTNHEIQLAGGVVADNMGRLLGIRATESGIWYVPGGKREAGETTQEAVEREFREELGVVAYAGEVIEATSFKDNDEHYRLVYCHTKIVRGTPWPQESKHDECEYLSLGRWRRMEDELSPGMRYLIKRITDGEVKLIA